MKTLVFSLAVYLTLFFSNRASATTFYVDANSANSTPPYADWSTAATNIQEAIDEATNGDLVLVTNGVYSSGGISMDGSVTNLVTLNKAVTVQSVNGPLATTIQNTGATKVRCAWLTNNAALIGFTLEGGSMGSESGGGVWGISSNQTLVANCIIVSNYTGQFGGGAYRVTLKNCLVSSNSANIGGGGGAAGAIVESCTIVSNSGNPGVYESTATNCIIYYNTFNGSPENYQISTFSYCCTTPLPAGQGNFTNAPNLFSDGAHLLAGSPCIGAGTNVVTGTDIFGQLWANPPSVGCAEWEPTPVITVPRVQFTSAPAGFTFTAAVDSQPPMAVWWLKDGAPIQSGGNYGGAASTVLIGTNLSLADAGGYQIVASNSYGVVTSIVATVNFHCVDAAGTNPVPPFSAWDTAATNIQDAINAAASGDVVLVTNGTYAGGGVTVDGVQTNRVALNKVVLVESVNGPWVTTIEGGGATNGPSAVRCAYVMDGAVLTGFTLTAGATGTTGSATTTQSGGAVWCTSSNAFVANCVIVSNTANMNAGGGYQGAFNNCLISSNAYAGVYDGTLTNCTVISNAAYGIYKCAAQNCIIYSNYDNFYVVGSVFSHCCVYPLPPAGTGNFTNAPLLFVDGIHLGTGSPCIHAGINASGVDIFGQPWANPPSIGCAEFQPTPVVDTPQLKLTSSPAGFTIGNVAVDGEPPFTYTWLENGLPLTNDGDFTSTGGSNLVATRISFADRGSYQLAVSNAYGVATSAVVSVTIHCVDANGTSPVPPYSTWATAATNIQDAIDNAAAGEVVLVTNGVYETGGISMDGVLTNRVTLDKAVTVISVNGFSTTTIQGAWDPNSTNGPLSVRCAWLTNGATLAGFTLQKGATLGTGAASSTQGGGAWCAFTNAIVCNCFLSNNIAIAGGGFANGTLNNSLGVLNLAQQGGGAYNATLNNCTLQENYTTTRFTGEGAGTYNCLVRNSIVVGNWDYYPYGTPIDDYNMEYSSFYTYSFSCTDSQFPGGTGNITGNPEFLDLYHISSSSPCRGAGSALYSSGTDLDGDLWANPPSMGCDEVVLSNLVGPLSVSLMSFSGTNTLINLPASFFGTVNGHAATVSWSFGDGSTATNIGVAVSHTWTKTGVYTVTLIAYNQTYPHGVSSNFAITVSLPPPPLLQNPIVTNNAMQFTFQPEMSATYTIQYTTNLTPPVQWQTLQTIQFAPPIPIQVSDPLSTNAARFYRVMGQ